MKIDLKKFCSRDRSKIIHETFAKGKWTYATDGNIIIRVPNLLHTPEKENTLDCEQLFKEADHRGPYHWVPIPKARHVSKDTPVKFPLGDDVILLNSRYLVLIRNQLPNPEIGLIKRAATKGIPVKIRFDGGKGLLMPMMPMEMGAHSI